MQLFSRLVTFQLGRERASIKRLLRRKASMIYMHSCANVMSRTSTSNTKIHITRIPVDRKFLEDLLANHDDSVPDYIEISHEYEALDDDQVEPVNSSEESFHRAWQSLAIMLSLSVMLAVFAIILMQVIRLLHGRRPLPSLSSLEMQSEHDRLQRTRYASCATVRNEQGGRPVCQVILSSKNFSVTNAAQRRRAAESMSRWNSVA